MDNICAHVRGLCSFFEQRHLKRFVGKLNSITDTATFVSACKELARILIKCESDKFEEIFSNDNPNPHWVFSEYQKGLTCTTFDGTKVKVYHRFEEAFLNDLLTMDPSNPNTHKVRAGLMKLHTSREGENPTRSEKDEIFSSISHVSAVRILGNQSLIDNYHPELIARDVIRHLLKKGGKPKRSYLPLFAVPPSDKSSYYLRANGSGKPLKRSALESFHTRGILRHPKIIQLYDTDPEEFIASGFTGWRDEGSFIIFDDNEQFPSDIPLGNIAAINERGNKKRVVASPNILVNIMAYPLANVLTELYERWSCQGCKSHEGTTLELSDRLRKSVESGSLLTFHSIDMKSFTDNLPYREFQRIILNVLVEQGVIPVFDLKVMDLLCSMKFKFLDTNKLVSYGTGTPMGSFPSFPLATLANGVMLAMASYRAGITDLDILPGRIIGDDIVIWDDAVAANYRDIAALYCMPISEDKCISSPYVAEMCSKIITPYGVFDQKKLKPTESAGALLADISYYGETFIQGLNEEYAKILKYFRMVPKPYGLGREIYEINSDLNLSVDLGLQADLLVSPIEIHFLMKHISNQIDSYLGMPFTKSSMHRMFQQMRYYPTIIPGKGISSDLSMIIEQDTVPINNVDPRTNLPRDLDGRTALRRMLKSDLESLGIMGPRRSRKLDGLRCYPSPEEQKILANIARVTEELEVFHSDDPQPLKPLAPIKDGGESDADSSVLEDSFRFYHQENGL